MIVTAGAIDCHVHFICPQLAYEAITSGEFSFNNLHEKKNCYTGNKPYFCISIYYAGITTLVGGGTGPADGTRATTCTPAPFHMKLMLQSTDDLPLNFGFTGKVMLDFLIYHLNHVPFRLLVSA